MMYYAHSAEEKIPAQSYEAHISGVRTRIQDYVKQLRKYAKKDGELLSAVAEKAAVFHDLGKLERENQDILSGEKSAKSLSKIHYDAGTAYLLSPAHYSGIAAVAIRSHHTGYPCFIDEKIRRENAFRVSEVMSETDKLLPTLEKIHNELIGNDIRYENEKIKGDRSVFFRMLLSCLADADHTDTAVNYGKYPVQPGEIKLRPAERLAQLDSYVSGLKGKNESRNALRREMYSACRDAEINANISSCDSPVGSGKTTAVMAHLLKQAEKRGLRRIFVILPFTNIIKQSVDTYRKALTLPGEKKEDVVAELHHRADFESYDARHLSALWRAPIIVTTAVAFFETLASNSTGALRRLHELPGSAVFIDESHAALPVKLLPLAWKWINIYADDWSCYWLLASGSLNRFWNIDEISRSYAPKTAVPEVVNDKLRSRLSQYEVERTNYRCDLQPKNAKELAEWVIGFQGPRLVIMNTVQSAAVLADLISKKYGRACVEHLSTALTPIDRENVIEKVKKRLSDSTDQDWTLVATSCVEAGVDLSFRTGFRELCSLVSLLQTAGRINRDGNMKDSEIWTFCIAEDQMLKANPGVKESAFILRGYLERGAEIKPELSTKSIIDEIALSGVTEKYRSLLKNESLQSFPLVEKEFKVIESNTQIAVVDQNLAESICHGRVDWRELQKKSVQISKYKLDELRIPKLLENLYWWNLDYNDFLGYMAGVINQGRLSGEAIIM